jgi:hypothetical protein
MSDRKMSELFAQDSYGTVPLPRPGPGMNPSRNRRYDLAQYLEPRPTGLAIEAGYNDINPRRPYGPPVPGFKPDIEGGFRQDMDSLRSISGMADPAAFEAAVEGMPMSANVDDRTSRKRR